MSASTPTPAPDPGAPPAATPAPSAPGAPAPATGADARNRRLLLVLAFCAAGLLLLLFAFFSVFFNRRPALERRAAQARGAAGQAADGNTPSILQRPVSTDVAGFTPARPARAEAPTPAPPPRNAPPPAAPPEFMPPPSIPAAFSVGAARRTGTGGAGGFGRGTVGARPAAAVRGVVPSYQVIPCKLVGALENSGNPNGGSGAGGAGASAGAGGQTSSIKALVDEDIRTWDTHEIIIPKGTQCNAVGNFQRGRDRVFVEGDFTFILPGRNPGQPPLELVLPGIAQDRAYDAQVDSWGVTDLSDGIRGDYLETRNFNELKVFAYKFLSGVSGALSATSASFGQTFANGATSAATGLPGFVVNPAVGGSQAVLDREAERIAAKIEADGYFLRVPAHKQFYVYVLRGFSLRDAKNSAEAAELRDQREDSRLRLRDERRARQRAAELGGASDPTGGLTGLTGLTADPALAALLTNPAGPLSAAGLRRPAGLPTPAPTPVRRPGNVPLGAPSSPEESAPLPVP